jgi:Uncharacterized conserved protein
MKAADRSATDFLRDILEAALKAERFVAGVNFEEFRSNDEKVYAVIRALEVIGEAAKNVPAQMRKQYSAIPWRIVAGMRDKLIHGYFGVDLERVWGTVHDDLPPLVETIRVMLAEEPAQEH